MYMFSCSTLKGSVTLINEMFVVMQRAAINLKSVLFYLVASIVSKVRTMLDEEYETYPRKRPWRPIGL
jgi:hypothetical protein